MHTSFGKQIKEERKKQGLTVQTIAKACGISRSYITLIENGRRLPGKKIIPKIAVALHLEIAVVLNWYLKDIGQNIHKDMEMT